MDVWARYKLDRGVFSRALVELVLVTLLWVLAIVLVFPNLFSGITGYTIWHSVERHLWDSRVAVDMCALYSRGLRC
jgi:hypothetical protein